MFTRIWYDFVERWGFAESDHIQADLMVGVYSIIAAHYAWGGCSSIIALLSFQCARHVM